MTIDGKPIYTKRIDKENKHGEKQCYIMQGRHAADTDPKADGCFANKYGHVFYYSRGRCESTTVCSFVDC